MEILGGKTWLSEGTLYFEKLTRYLVDFSLSLVISYSFTDAIPLRKAKRHFNWNQVFADWAICKFSTYLKRLVARMWYV